MCPATRPALGVAISAAVFTALSGLENQSGPLSDLYLGRTDNINIRFAAAIALLFNVLMVVVAIMAIARTVPRDNPDVGR
jgi:DHA2 family multidrug resistance protein-like MFS transporter